MKKSEIIKFVVDWIKSYKDTNNIDGLVVGVSGGIDSALTSTLCGLSGIKTLCLNMPIRQKEDQYFRAKRHIEWLIEKYENIQTIDIDLTNVFYEFKSTVEKNSSTNKLALANTRSRIRMMTLYYHATINNSIVVGTGNKVEDFGVGFYTKYGDGGVDISPIADCTKTQVWELGKYLGVSKEIINSQPTDGLWDDGRNDVQQLGMSYEDLEKAMENKNDPNYQKYLKIREKNLHKMNPIPVCKFNE